ncbi:hypothetical protein P2O56_22240, partial [Escherichia coli]|nr:hypothetical protein [Escherichia coli]
DRNRSHWSTSKTPSYTKSVSWQHHQTAPNELRFTRNGNQLRVDNPTVFNITFNQFFANDKEIEKAGMVPAKGALNITLPAGVGSVSKIKYNAINDFGSSAEMITKNVD